MTKFWETAAQLCAGAGFFTVYFILGFPPPFDPAATMMSYEIRDRALAAPQEPKGAHIFLKDIKMKPLTVGSGELEISVTPWAGEHRFAYDTNYLVETYGKPEQRQDFVPKKKSRFPRGFSLNGLGGIPNVSDLQGLANGTRPRK